MIFERWKSAITDLRRQLGRIEEQGRQTRNVLVDLAFHLRESRKVLCFVTITTPEERTLGSQLAWLSPGDRVTLSIDPQEPVPAGSLVRVSYPFVLEYVLVGNNSQSASLPAIFQELRTRDAAGVGSRVTCYVLFPQRPTVQPE